jgi:hypothetical protein
MNLEPMRQYVKGCLNEADQDVRARTNDARLQQEFDRKIGGLQARTAAYIGKIENGQAATANKLRGARYQG